MFPKAISALPIKPDVSLLPLTNCFKEAQRPNIFRKCKVFCVFEHANQKEKFI